MDDMRGWPAELACFRCGLKLMPEVKEGEPIRAVRLVDTDDGRRRFCCEVCLLPGDRVV